MDYDKVGNGLKEIDELGETRTNAYDELDRLISITDKLGNISKRGYTNNGLIKSKIDAKGNKTSYEYDSLNRLVKETNALGHDINYNYDKVDNLIGINQVKTITDEVYKSLPDKNSLSNGGFWKMADTIKGLSSKKTRLGTYDINLTRIGN